MGYLQLVASDGAPVEAAGLDSMLSSARADASDGDLYKDTNTGKIFLYRDSGSGILFGSQYAQDFASASLVSNASGDCYITLADALADVTSRGFVETYSTGSGFITKTGGSALDLLAPNTAGASSALEFTPSTSFTSASKLLIVAKVAVVNDPGNGNVTMRAFDGTSARLLGMGSGGTEGQLIFLNGSSEIGSNTVPSSTSARWITLQLSGSGDLVSVEMMEDRPGHACAVDYASFAANAANRLELKTFTQVADRGQLAVSEYFAFVA